MIQTLPDVIANHDNLLQEFNRANEGAERDPLFDSSRMNGVIILPDEVASGFLLANYSFNTHFVPGCLPASGEIIGDFLEHEGKTYLTLHFGAMISNLKLFHLIRGIEPIYRDWYEHANELNQEVEGFVEQLRAEERNIEAVDIIKQVLDKSEKWRASYVGWNHLGTPCPQFVDALSEISSKCTGTIAEKALDLERKLRPYYDLPKIFKDFRSQIGHKGIPLICDGIVTTNKPAASGGASIHTHCAGDDLKNALPNANDMFIVAAQAGAIGVMHFGGGNIKGEHMIFLPPRTPFFDLAQEAIDINSELKDKWREIKSNTEGDLLEDAVNLWLNATREIKEEVMQKVIPEIISQRVLGFHVDLKSQHRVAQLHPIISECACAINQKILEKQGWEVLAKDIDSVLLEAPDGYFAISPVC